ncbi:diguanylate cyclase [Methylobacterium organophilum]|uniref:GGDEF domain-containing protein n=1 Tax=Methylobacterium organophilum TaxID=410 RepID=UPI001F12C829|nr:diguanylate cyclase [Methylobacterium organophilum]UMY16441.1 diguanylate cyclase [Methylobacterium organophilum]
MQRLIEAGLSRPWYRLRLPAPLEARYRAETARQNGLYVQTWLGVFVLFNVLSLAMDYDAFGPEAFAVPLVLTLGVFCPITLTAIVLLRGRPTVMRLSCAALATSLVDLAVVLNSARLVPASHTASYVIIAAIVPLVVGLIAPQPFRHSLWFCGSSLILYVGMIVAFGLTDAAGNGLPLLVSGLIVVPLKLHYSNEWEAKKVFLAGLRESLQAEALAEANARLRILSETDSLTGVANRRHFSDRLDEAWEACERQEAWLGVILVDIDHFKRLNDAAGHAEGDRCLVQVAAALRGAIAASGGLVARYGGEEFAAFLPGATLAEACAAAEALRAAVAELAIPHPGQPQGARLTVSIGVTAAYGPTRWLGIAYPDLLKSADQALYLAKAQGRDRVASATAAHNANWPPLPAEPGLRTDLSTEARRPMTVVG